MNSLDANHELLQAARAFIKADTASEMHQWPSVREAMSRLKAAVALFDPTPSTKYAPIIADMNARLAKVQGETQDGSDTWQSEH